MHKKTVRRIGLLGGTFDPIHFGHLNLALQMKEMHSLDEVLFCPAALSPLKESKPWQNPEKRRKMVELAIEPIKEFSLLDVEINRPAPSYTIDTVHFLIERAKRENRNEEIYLILGEDALEHFSKWKQVDELIKLAPPLIGARQGYPPLEKRSKQQITQISIMEISSTQVRERLLRGLYCGHLVPAKVLDYIIENELY